jgi:hypothetical protein
MLQERPSASKREHPALQKRIFLIFSIIVGHFPLLDPDPDPAAQNQHGSKLMRYPSL